MAVDWLIHNVRIADGDVADWRRSPVAAVGIDRGVICFCGDQADAPAAARSVDGGGGWLTPGLIDCHTHLVYGGNRAGEFAERLRGASYAEIARRGGGILSTVAATREASEDELFASALARLQVLAGEGVTTVEIKSGYGLDVTNERKMLRVARRLGEASGLRVVTTLLAAHALPPEYADRGDAYIREICDEILPAVAAEGLADAVDVFCEHIAFSVSQCRRVFDRARGLGIPVKGHVEQLSHSGGAALVAEYRGLSADHVEYLSTADVGSLRDAGTVAVLLPGAFYTLRERQRPPVAALRAAGVPMAVASDLNPGSAPIASLLLNMNMACVLFELTAEEALLGVTRHAAAALALEREIGRVAPGFAADLVLWSVEDPAELSYGHGLVKPQAIWRGGAHVD